MAFSESLAFTFPNNVISVSLHQAMTFTTRARLFSSLNKRYHWLEIRLLPSIHSRIINSFQFPINRREIIRRNISLKNKHQKNLSTLETETRYLNIPKAPSIEIKSDKNSHELIHEIVAKRTRQTATKLKRNGYRRKFSLNIETFFSSPRIRQQPS